MSDVHEIEIGLEDAKKTAAKGDALARLSRNPDFVSLVMKGYFEEEATRLVMAKSNPGMQTPERQAANLRSIDSVGELYQYFLRIDMAADAAAASISDMEEVQAEMAEQGEL
jgi:hypothetical protein